MGAGKAGEAIETLREVIRTDPDHGGAHKTLGTVLLGEGELEGAIASYRRAIALDPSDCTLYHNLGTALQQLGRLDQAAEAYQKALEINPDFTVSRRQLSGVKKFDPKDLDIPELQRQLKNEDLAEMQRAELYFAMAKSFDDIGDYDKAFSALQAANQIVRRDLEFSSERNSQYVNRMIDTFTPEFLAERKSFGSSSEVPVFIIGMPRSGTTLVEQIICSHPQVFGAGELMHMHKLFTAIPDQLKTKQRFPEVAAEIDETMTLQLAEDYLGYLRSLDDSATRITDKMPFNFRMLGAIAMVFPKARFIHTRRNPLDVCLSCYFARFRDALDFSYNLLDVGHYYREYERLMAYWKSVLDIQLMEVQYEELVANQEEISRQMIKFCGLEWDDRCLSFHEKERPVLTASNWQVRQPMYSTSVERWRNYEKYLGPLMSVLGKHQQEGKDSLSMNHGAASQAKKGTA
jgi:tetratricopeptide (TPR) repeat protein